MNSNNHPSKAATTVPDDFGKGRTWIITGTAALLLFGALFRFVRLGHYALWDDEAMTPLVAKNVWRTGDTGIRIGHNLVLTIPVGPRTA